MKKEITLKPKKLVEAFCGEESLGTFEITSEWNGMAELRNKDSMIIVDRSVHVMRGINAVLDMDEVVHVVKISPTLSTKLFPANVKVMAPLPAGADMETGSEV